MAVGYTRAPRTGAQDSVPSADPRRDMATVTKDTNAEATIREIIANHEVFAEGIAASMARYMAKIENANPARRGRGQVLRHPRDLRGEQCDG